jgi:hypothetical protein
MLHASEAPPHASELAPELPLAVDVVFFRALAKDPEHRPRSAAVLVDTLRAALEENAAPTRLLVPPASEPRGRRRHARWPALVAAVLALAGAGAAAGIALSDDESRRPSTVVVTDTVGPRSTQVRTVTVEQPPPPMPAPASAGSSLSSAAAANDRAYRMMLEKDFEAALPVLEEAYATLAGSGSLAEAYTAYNLAFTRFALGSCNDVLQLLDRSESIQGERKEIGRLRHQAEKSCAGGGNGRGRGKGNDGDDD